MSEWFDLVKKSESIALFAHINSDGDANGSVMAMYHLLKGMDKKVYVFVPTPISLSYHFLGVNEITCKNYAKHYDLAIGLDCPNTKRFGQCEPEFFKAKKSICIDHHLESGEYADIKIVNTDVSSTCELLWTLFEKENIIITPEIATALYLGIATDTGGFIHGAHGDVDKNTWLTVSRLADLGAKFGVVNENMFTTIRKPVFELYRYALANVEFYENGRIVMVAVRKKIFEQTGTELTDTHKFLDVISGIEGVEITAVMSEREFDEQAVSVRSKKRNAQRICKFFGGGGHLRASGCRIFVPFDEAKQQLLNECKKELCRND